MTRTKHRALPKGLISPYSALIYALFLGLIGFGVVMVYTNLLTTSITAFAFIAYVVLYGIGKYRSIHGTLVGSISGAMPPVIGYCAVSNQLDVAAFLLFIIMVFWQMAHFFSIALYRLNDYKMASIPSLTCKKIHLYYPKYIYLAKCCSVYYSKPPCSLSLGYTGYAYLIVTSPLSLLWLLFID